MSIDFPQRHEDVEVAERDEQVLALTSTGNVVPLNVLQADLLSRFNGTSSLEDMAQQCEVKFEQEVPVEAVARFVDKAKRLGLLSLRSGGLPDEELAAGRCGRVLRRIRRWAPPEDARAAGELFRTLIAQLEARQASAALATAYTLEESGGRDPWAAAIVREVERLGAPPAMGDSNLFRITIPVIDPSSWIVPLARRLAWLFTRGGAALSVAYLIGASWLFARLSFPQLHLDWIAWTTFYLLFALQTFVHEVAHALVCAHYGGRVRQMGVGLLYGMPMAYCDVSSSYLFASKRHRLMVPAAGSIGSLLALATLVYVATLLPESSVRTGVLYALVGGVLFDVALNLLPFAKLDGYYVLAEALDLPNLHGRSLELAGALCRRAILGPSAELPSLTRREHWLLVSYAVVGTLGTCAVVVSSAAWAIELLVPRLGPSAMLLVGGPLALGLGFLLWKAGGHVLRFVIGSWGQLRSPRPLAALAIIVGLVLTFFFAPLIPRAESRGRSTAWSAWVVSPLASYYRATVRSHDASAHSTPATE